MIVTELQGNIHDTPLPEGTHLETVTMPSDQLVKRIQRVRTDHDREVGIRLPSRSPDLQDGDILYLEDGNAIVLRVEASDVLVIQARSILEMARVAHSLGNRHLQAQFFDANSEYEAEVMVVQYDYTVEDYLKSVSVPYQRQDRIMPVPFRHSEHTH